VEGRDDLGLRQNEGIIVALEVLLPVLEALAPVTGLVELVALDHRTHRPIDDEDALGRGLF